MSLERQGSFSFPSGGTPKTIWDLRRGPWTSEPRFYPPGQHPATAGMLKQLKYAEGLRDRSKRAGMLTADLDEFIAYVGDKMAEFEQAEGDAKVRAWRYFD